LRDSLLLGSVAQMFGSSGPPDPATKPRPWSVWVRYANSMLPVAAVFGGIGLVLLGLSLLGSPQFSTGTRAVALADLAVAAIAAVIGLWWRRRRRRAA
jgi:hypothetical protein